MIRLCKNNPLFFFCHFAQNFRYISSQIWKWAENIWNWQSNTHDFLFLIVLKLNKTKCHILCFIFNNPEKKNDKAVFFFLLEYKVFQENEYDFVIQ